MNDFFKTSTGLKPTPLNVVITSSSFNGKSVVKLGDTVGKHSGDKILLQEVKKQLGYAQIFWDGSDE